MANINTAFGLRPVGILGSAPNSAGTTEYRINPSNSDKIWQGTVVLGANDGYIVRGSASGSGQNPIGVFLGCVYHSVAQKKPIWSNYWPGSDADSNFPVRAYVYDNPMQLFVVAADEAFASAAAAQAAVFGNANLADGNDGVDSTGMSVGVLDVSTVNTTANHALRIIGYSEDPANSDISEPGVGVIVRLNRHFNSPVGTTTGLHA